MNKDNTDNKDQIKDSSTKSKKSSYSKKKKSKKNILNGIAYVQSTFLNRFLLNSGSDGCSLTMTSCGSSKFMNMPN